MTVAAVLAWARPHLAAALAWAKEHPSIVLGVLLALVALHDVRGCRRASSAEATLAAEHARAKERRDLEAKNVEVVEQDDQDDVDHQVAELEARNEDLRRENERLRSAVPSARPVAAARASTGPVTAGGTPRGPNGARDACQPPGYDGLPPVASVPPTSSQVGGTCLLAAGDVAEARVDAVAWRTEAGNHLLTLSLGGYRLQPGPETRLFGGPATLTRAVELEPPPLPAGGNGAGWGAGPVGGATGAGWLAGLVLATPSVRLPLIGLRGEWWATAAGGPGGFVALTGPLLRR